jgi:galactose-1-phosphate uridylyltransferase
VIVFDRHEIVVPLHLPEGVREVTVELRRDPLSGEQARVTPRRPVSRLAGETRLQEVPAEPGPCPLCPEHLPTLTPRLDPRVFPERHLERGEATLFPNLYPYGRWSAVIALTTAHLVPLDAYTVAHYTDGLLLAREYAARLAVAGEGGPFVGVTQNHLPTSGGTLMHPHLQVQVDERPNNFFDRVQAGLVRHRTAHGSAFFDELVAEEERLGERFIGWNDDLALLVPFAPRGFAEVWMVFPGLRSLGDLTEPRAAALASELVTVLGVYRALGWNAFNLALTADERPGSDLPLWCRVVLRGRFGPFARSDVSFHEKLFEELSTSVPPEMTAERMRAARDAIGLASFV